MAEIDPAAASRAMTCPRKAVGVPVWIKVELSVSKMTALAAMGSSRIRMLSHDVLEPSTNCSMAPNAPTMKTAFRVAFVNTTTMMPPNSAPIANHVVVAAKSLPERPSSSTSAARVT